MLYSRNLNTMKYLIICLLLIIQLQACEHADNNQILQNRIDTLEKKISDTYKPGFGEFMSSIQVHHSKLWFAGENQNWKLADFEIHEIMESIEDIKKYQTERVESQKIDMITPALDSVNAAINQKNPTAFKTSYILLTNTCNNCHHAVNFEFNVVKIPGTPPFDNQSFKMDNTK
ncbi:MAG: hypothetical protein JWO92_2475 [Chitinophagaceae bacterium]|nr:hypothetical protein [Chitinophagaceae bacterium]MDB5223653.1 hypothetical protein [Chitinophagaceae bacterium]